MNRTELIGRLTKDPEVKYTQNQLPFCNFIVAVDRRFKDANGQRQADFIACVAWRATADFIGKYFKKGSKIAVVGSIQTRSYEDQEGKKHLVTEVVVDEAEFVESKSNSNGSGNANANANTAGNANPATQEQEVGEPTEVGNADMPFDI